MPQSEARRLLRRCLRRNISGAQANRFVLPVQAAVRIMRRPARFFLEQPDRTNAAVSAQLEPLHRPAPQPDQSPALEFLDLLSVGAEDLVRGGIARQLGRGLPAFVLNTNSSEIIADFVVFAERTIFIGYLENGHTTSSAFGRRMNYADCAAPERTSTSIRNSRISTCRLASRKPTPQV